MDIRAFGERALLIELPDFAGVQALLARIHDLPGAIDIVPAAKTIMVNLDTAVLSLAGAIDEIQARAKEATEVTVRGKRVEIPVEYSGEDLAQVAELHGMSVAELIEWHTSQDFTAAFGGFAPGFCYLLPTEKTLVTPRLSSPRAKIPAGSVGLAGEFSGIYPGDSPGGWQLIGHTDAPLWDLSRPSPALITPGDSVRFVPKR